MKATLHGSMRKDYEEGFVPAHRVFTKAGIEVIAPIITEIEYEKDGFVYSKGDDTTKGYIHTETNFLSKVASLNPQKDFAYIINPKGTLGVSGAAELAFLLSQHKNIFALNEITDPPLPMPDNYVYSPQELVAYIKNKGSLPKTDIINKEIAAMLKNTFYALPAIGSIVVDETSKTYTFGNKKEPIIGLIQTGGREGKYTILGGSKLPGETDDDRLSKEFQDQLGISKFSKRNIIIKFPEIGNGYREFTDYLCYAKPIYKSNQIRLPPSVALDYPSLIEENALKTIKKYAHML
ncbi:MAG: hypothetical protein NT085_01935 [candidate division SR1 bacterium]|nr:hypothetical protein [candidate division SR1 bacterium]